MNTAKADQSKRAPRDFGARFVVVAGLVAGLVAALVGACGPTAEDPEPVYDDDLGLQAVAVDEGALDGRWLMKGVTLGVAELPLIGEQETGGESYYWFDLTWDAASSSYSFEAQLCGGRTYDTGASVQVIPTSTWRAIPRVDQGTISVDHALGTFAVSSFLELWGLQNLPDPYGTDLPQNSDEAAAPPHSTRIYDVDGDGNPGVTVSVTGALEGDVFFVQRKNYSYDGLVLDPDRIVGLITWAREQITIGSTNPLLNSNLGQAVHPDPKEHWFELVRVADETDCDAVQAGVDAQTVSRLRPF